ncbi:MAG: DUF1385 domain-containing protein [Myxococcaceae bacterium]|nr:MAG: DUF1385 domain-containing protein [Myxococcaceae bacterium]
MGERPYIGGQAVLEGVMMRSPGSLVVAVRRPDGQIAVREEAWETLWPRAKLLRKPFLRGAVVLIESVWNGFTALAFSAEQAESENPSASAAPAGLAPAPSERKSTSELTRGLMLGISFLFMVGLFIAAPHLLTLGLFKLLGRDPSLKGLLFHLVDGVFRIAILVGWLALVARTKDAQRLFQYHGAEHKAIWTYESRLPLTVESARRFTTQHPRCGTSFLFVVVGVAVLVHILVLPFVPTISAIGAVQTLFVLVLKIGLAFPVAGIAYELQKRSARADCPRLLKALVSPGLWLQRITTVEPTDDQLEIALLALDRALAREEGRPRAADGVQVYPDFAVAAAA